MSQVVTLTILDDIGFPKLEGEERLLLVLQAPTNASLGHPASATIVISDSHSDLPKFNFISAAYSGYEGDGEVIAWIGRSGDISHAASVRCYTRQDTAEVALDFDERPDTNASLVHFEPGEKERPCRVILVNDHKHEKDETLKLVLGSAFSETANGALLGPKNTTVVTIKDEADKSTLQFEQLRMSVDEPATPGQQKTVNVWIVRGGDLTLEVQVQVHTKDGSATSGQDYYGVSKDLVFAPNISRLDVGVVVLGDALKENRESFTLHLKPLHGSSSNVDIIGPKIIVYIEEMNIVADVTFPSRPVVISLRDYDVTHAAPDPIPGYPVVCVTPCDPKHPDYAKTGPICHHQEINDSLTTFRWQVAAPSGPNDIPEELRDVSSYTVFTDTRGRSLDSLYFSARSRIRCLARAYSNDGDAGLEIGSTIVSVAQDGGLCPPRMQGTFGAEPFTAKMRYTGPDDQDHPNLVRLEVIIPHKDGMIPAISTRKLSHFEMTLSRDGVRIGNHRCSNLLDVHEVRTLHGFLSNETRSPNAVVETEPHQYSSFLRTDATLR
ncbi:FRAS1-related extracellular matrix protein 2-like [Palaemon carinicauda]|uniref:FRAS1-related extracellular matrix protein 2-like n=1 Tax=Palaemon carinicauda TaxID=392227 RepID=UPI0035B68846